MVAHINFSSKRISGIRSLQTKNKRASTLLHELCNIFSLNGTCRQRAIKVKMSLPV